MTRLTKSMSKSMTTAAAVLLVTLLVTAGVASAQSTMKAEVPFAFTVGNKVMEPGTIRVRLVNENSIALIVNNQATHESYIVLPASVGEAPRQWTESGLAKLGFECTEGSCTLVRVWRGTGYAYGLHGPKTRNGEVHLTEIAMKPDKGD
jgi:hypothetical protein